MASGASLVSSVASHVHSAENLNNRADDLAQKQAQLNAGTAPKNVTAQSLDRANRNLSHAQFRHRMDVANTTSQALSGAVNNASRGAQAPPSAIGPGLYS